jgi:DNA mismatch endonuclease, patch repair protein
MDLISKKHRSWNMSRIRAEDTTPEIIVRSLLHCLGYRFRLHRRDLPGKPDIVLPRFRTTIFVHGCFWHRHAKCRYSYVPKSRITFWNSKFTDNVARDKRVTRELVKQGWRVLVVWECETKNLEHLSKKLTKYFQACDS